MAEVTEAERGTRWPGLQDRLAASATPEAVDRRAEIEQLEGRREACIEFNAGRSVHEPMETER